MSIKTSKLKSKEGKMGKKIEQNDEEPCANCKRCDIHVVEIIEERVETN